MASMAANGHHAALHLAHTMGYQRDPQVCDAAAGGGHLELVRWLRENGCPEVPEAPEGSEDSEGPDDYLGDYFVQSLDP